MIVSIEHLVPLSTATGTSFTFLHADLDEVMSQPGARHDKVGLVSFREGTTTFQAAVGILASSGTNMTSLHHLAAKPCPPFCPKKVYSKGVPAPFL